MEVLDFKNENLLSDSLHNEVYSILDYMDDFHGFSAIRTWYTQDIDSIVDLRMKSKKINYINEAEIYMNAMGLEYENRYDVTKNSIIFSTKKDNESLANVTGYNYYKEFNCYAYANDNEFNVTTFKLDSVSFQLRFLADKNHLIMEAGDMEYPFINQPTNINFNELLNRLYNESENNDVDASKLDLKAETDKYEVKLQINTLELQKKSKNRFKVNNFSGSVLIRKKS